MIKEYWAYLNDNPQGYWFKHKLYGWGWTPVTWQGWILVGGYIAAVVWCASTVQETATLSQILGEVVAPVILLTGGLIWACYQKGESPRWQWGMPKK